MAAEAVVFFNAELARDFAFRSKRGGHLLSKMRLVSAQLDAYLTDGLWLDNARHANAMARRLVAGLTPLKGTQLMYPVDANEIFVVMPAHMHDALQDGGAKYHPWPSDRPGERAFRLVTAFDTDPPMSIASCPSPNRREIYSVSIHDPSAHPHRRPLGRLRGRVRRQRQGGAAPSFLQGSRSLADRPAHAVRRGDAAARAPAGDTQELAGRKARRAPEERGQEPFVEVEWDQALDLVATELKRVKDTHSNRSIFGGSYGWSSAGRFHHAQSQVHRFLNSVGGYVRHVDYYSLGAARPAAAHRGADGRADVHAHAVGRHGRALQALRLLRRRAAQEQPGQCRAAPPASRERRALRLRAKRRALRQRDAACATISTPAAPSSGSRSGPTPTPP